MGAFHGSVQQAWEHFYLAIIIFVFIISPARLPYLATLPTGTYRWLYSIGT
jgi:Sec-independent protein secretion pathway component TatC